MKTIYSLVSCIFLYILLFPVSGFSIALRNQTIVVEGNSASLRVPKSMKLEFISSMPGPAPRFLSAGPDDEFIVGSRGATLFRIRKPYLQPEILVSLSGFIHSAVYRQGRIYAAETAAIWSAPYSGVDSSLQSTDFSKYADLPSMTGGHSSRTIINGPDNRLYLGLGISGNCSDEYLHQSYPFERRRGGVFVVDNGLLIPFSSGLRNPIGLAFRPVTGTLYATNAGSDNLGYDNPPEILTALHQDSFHGMPWFQYYNGLFNRQDCIASDPPRPSSQAIPPVAFFSARSTPLGIVFLETSSLGQRYSGSSVVAIHGSWATRPGEGQESRREPKLSLVLFDDGEQPRVEDLVTGFQRDDGSRFARPSDVIVGGDNHIYFTSDGGEVTGLFRLVPRMIPEKKTVNTGVNILLQDD